MLNLTPIKERLAKATPGPWHTGGIFSPLSARPTQNVWPPAEKGKQSADHEVCLSASLIDADFIAHSWDDIRDLIAEVERLTRLLNADPEGAEEGDSHGYCGWREKETTDAK